MTNPTSNFGWQMPTSTDLVTDLPADFETFGQAVDTSLADLKGGTTGQVLSKASNTDMDFTWVAQDDSNAIQNAIVDAKGDLIAASAADAPARLAVGNNGETLVADSSTATGLRYQGNFAAGKNKIINGDFGIWQRGTSFSNPKGVYTADRFQYNYDGTGNLTLSQQSFTAGTAPVAGYEGKFFLRVNQTTAGSGGTFNVLQQPIEDVRTFAGQTVTVSFWAKADATRTTNVSLVQTFGTGGSSSAGYGYTDVTLTTSWARYSVTIAVGSIAGKTIGTGDPALRLFFDNPKNTTFTIDFWGVQVEAGSVATAFQTATGTIQGELAACQRYYWRGGTVNLNVPFSMIATTSATKARTTVTFPVYMRVPPTSIDFSTLAIFDSFSPQSVTALTSANGAATIGTNAIDLELTFSGSAAGRPGFLYTANGSGYLGFSAEL